MNERNIQNKQRLSQNPWQNQYAKLFNKDQNRTPRQNLTINAQSNTYLINYINWVYQTETETKADAFLLDFATNKLCDQNELNTVLTTVVRLFPNKDTAILIIGYRAIQLGDYTYADTVLSVLNLRKGRLRSFDRELANVIKALLINETPLTKQILKTIERYEQQWRVIDRLCQIFPGTLKADLEPTITMNNTQQLKAA